MRNSIAVSRRGFLAGGAGLVGAVTFGGCDRLAGTEAGRRVLAVGEEANLYVQRLLLTQSALAPEYGAAEISKFFKPNGTEDPPDSAYKALARKKFVDYRLEVSGLVERPFKVLLPDIRKMPSRTQITRHDCVEGWSCIGKWTGVPMRALLDQAGLKPSARYVVLHCADTMEGGEADDDSSDDSGSKGSKKQSSKGTDDNQSTEAKKKAPAVRYYETIDLTDAFHPQTILAYEMNDAPLPVAHGAPLRLRVERALGYKMAKYVMGLELVEDFSRLGDGKGGYWEDRGYDWYAGI
jgi:DMSO/TMAO reductase YedYZ molybdopterin-dependent catalytic subunit